MCPAAKLFGRANVNKRRGGGGFAQHVSSLRPAGRSECRRSKSQYRTMAMPVPTRTRTATTIAFFVKSYQTYAIALSARCCCGLSLECIESAERHAASSGLDDVDAALVRTIFVVSVRVHERLDGDAEEVLRPPAEAATRPGVVQLEVHPIGEPIHVVFIPDDPRKRQGRLLVPPREERETATIGIRARQRAEVVFAQQSAALQRKQANRVGHRDAVRRIDFSLIPPAPRGRLVGDATNLGIAKLKASNCAQLIFVDAFDDRAGEICRQIVAHDRVEHRAFAGQQVGAAQGHVACGVQAVELQKKLQTGATRGQFGGQGVVARQLQAVRIDDNLLDGQLPAAVDDRQQIGMQTAARRR